MGISIMEKDSIRPMKKVVLTGVESSGKTVLSQSIAGNYHCPMVKEYSRTYLKVKGLNYEQSDLVHILQGQLDLEAAAMLTNPNMIVCDTGPIVIKVWSLFKYGSVDSRIEQAVQSYRADLFILPDPEDISFEEDALRESPQDRDPLFQLYLNELIQLDIPFLIVTGSFEDRLNQVRNAIDGLLS